MTHIIRDHDADRFQAKKERIKRAAKWCNDIYGEGTVAYEITDSYANMEPQIKPHWHLIETAYEAGAGSGGEPYSIPVRGGTDGARPFLYGPSLSKFGNRAIITIPLEYARVQAMDDCVAALVKIAEKYGARPKL